MSQKYEKLKTLLKELFQLDQPDLDFGLYRVMHAKAAEVTRFLDQDLLPQVRQSFEQYRPADTAELTRELARAIEQAHALGADPETLPKVKELRHRLANEAVDIGALESEVYDHLFGFFRRYYSEGDFLAKRVYKPGVYAIPYEGEEVALHWANKDQYYIKTSEYLRDYVFCLRPYDDKNLMRVHFRLVDAAEGEHGNVKAAEGKDRVFILSEKCCVAEEQVSGAPELAINFEYRPATLNDWPTGMRDGKGKPPVQKDLIDLATRRVLSTTDNALAGWIAELAKPHMKADGEKADYSRLEAHLRRYAARNTFDYFIHKDLGGFLRRELDFYIKNEIMHLDDVENETAPKVEQYLSKIRVIRKIAGKIIDFLAQLEDFQRKLWLKKKFVIETQYCITLDRVPEQFYPEIAANDAQREEWVRLFGIEAIDGYSVPLATEFLARNKTLLVNTVHFSHDFRDDIVGRMDDYDGSLGGLLIHSDNYQALRLLERGHSGRVTCIYIDPPYNTDVSAIPYKNNYRHSSYATLICDRAELLRSILAENGVLFVSIDKHERRTVEFALDAAFGSENKVEELIWVQNTNDGRSPTYSVNHEYIEVYARNRPAAEADSRIFREPKPGFIEVTELIQRLNPEYPAIATIERELRALYKEHQRQAREAVESQGLDWEVEKRNDPWNGVYQYRFAEYRDSGGRYVEETEARDKAATIWAFRESDWTIMSAEDKQSDTIKDANHPNFRFYRPNHPITGKPCAMPSRGWKGTQNVDPKYPHRNSWESLLNDHRIVFGLDENKVPQQKRMLHEVETNVCKSVFADYSDGEKETSLLFGRTGVFLAPKHTNFVRRFLRQVVVHGSVVLDCFGGSGSTAHAVILTNREESLDLRYVLVEVNAYFDTVLLPRVLKGVYSSLWDNGRPVKRDGLSHCVKVIRLESYEDALNNLDLRRTQQQQTLFDAAEAQGGGGLKEQYLLRYMLEVESRDNQSLLNAAAFSDPTSYRLRAKRPGSDETRELSVDLVETFNYLIGLTVKHLAAPQTFTAEFERDGEKRLRLKGRLKPDASGAYWFRTVSGTTPDGRKTLVIWRKRPGGETAEGIEQDNLVLDEWFTRQGYSSRDSEFDLIYVNGDNNLENLKVPDDTWKVRLIEEDFHRLMFDTEGA